MLLLKEPPELYKLSKFSRFMAQTNELQTDLREHMESLVKSYEEMMTRNETVLYKMLLNEYTEECTIERYMIALKILSRRYAGLRKKWRTIVQRKRESD